MNFLGIDTTSKNELIVAHINGKDYMQFNIGAKHSEGLLTHVEELLTKAKATLNDIDVFGNISGPGSFTGIRIGLTTIKAFASALRKPVVNVSRFDVLSTICSGYVVLECTKSSVYYAFINDGNIEYGVSDTAKLVDVINPQNTVHVLDCEHLTLPDAYKNIVTINNYHEYVLPYMLNKAKKGETHSSNEITPLYIQLSQAERNWGDTK